VEEVFLQYLFPILDILLQMLGQKEALTIRRLSSRNKTKLPQFSIPSIRKFLNKINYESYLRHQLKEDTGCVITALAGCTIENNPKFKLPTARKLFNETIKNHPECFDGLQVPHQLLEKALAEIPPDFGIRIKRITFNSEGDQIFNSHFTGRLSVQPSVVEDLDQMDFPPSTIRITHQAGGDKTHLRSKPSFRPSQTERKLDSMYQELGYRTIAIAELELI
jgi:hypothetical protein